jgi:hypothetical protein
VHGRSTVAEAAHSSGTPRVFDLEQTPLLSLSGGSDARPD